MSDLDDLITFLRARLDETAYAVRWCDEHGTDLMKAMQGRFPVLADVNAKRKIIERFELARAHSPSPAEVGSLGRVLRILATPYAAHPEYREEWRP